MIKNNLFKLFSLFLTVSLLFTSCEEETDQWIYDGPALASFPNATSGTFFVEDVSTPTFTVEVGLNTVTGSDRTIQIMVDEANSTAENGVHVNVPTEVTIPANQAVASFTVSGNYDQLPNQPLTLTLKIAGDNAAGYDNTFSLSVNKFVPFDIENFTGTFECVENSFFGVFTYDVTLTKVDGTTDQVSISPFGAGMEAAYGLSLGGMNPLVITFHTDDPASFSTSMPETEAFLNGGVPSYYSEATGNLNTLTNTFTLGEVTIYDAEGAWDIISGVTFTKK